MLAIPRRCGAKAPGRTPASDQEPVLRCRAIGIADGKTIDRDKIANHFDITVRDDGLTVERRSPPIDAEASLDGIQG
jgi:hypothetical protein